MNHIQNFAAAAANLAPLGQLHILPPHMLPITKVGIRQLTHQDIQLLQVAYNEDLGIQANDAIAVRQARVETFLCGVWARKLP